MVATDIVLILGAVGVLITSVVGAIVTLRRVDETKRALKEDVQGVHKIVNQQRTDMMSYQEKLIAALVAAGIHVPEDKSLKKQ